LKGVRPRDENRVKERNDFVRDLFVQDFKVRSTRNFVDPPLSAPKAQKEFKKRFGVQMNSQRLYDMRKGIFAEQGLDHLGRPLGGHRPAPITTANRMEDDPLFHVAVLNIKDEVEGLLIRDALTTLASKKLIPSTVKVDAIHSHYMTVSNFPAE